METRIVGMAHVTKDGQVIPVKPGEETAAPEGAQTVLIVERAGSTERSSRSFASRRRYRDHDHSDIEIKKPRMHEYKINGRWELRERNENPLQAILRELKEKYQKQEEIIKILDLEQKLVERQNRIDTSRFSNTGQLQESA